MASPITVEDLLKIYSIKINKPEFLFSLFTTFVSNYIKTYISKHPSLTKYLDDLTNNLKEELRSLQDNDACKLELENYQIQKIIYYGFFEHKIKKIFEEIDQNADRPFPEEEQLELHIPSSRLQVIDIKQDFVKLLENNDFAETELVKIVFPDGINSVIVDKSVLKRKLLELSVKKIKIYLNTKRNAEYIKNKLQLSFSNRAQSFKDILFNIQTNAVQTVNTILKPNDFSFKFWSHMSTSILNDFKEKETKLAAEHSFCQAAYFIGFYNVFFKGRSQREKEKAIALRIAQFGIRKAPYYFTISDIYTFKDKNGFPISKKLSLDELKEFIDIKSSAKQGTGIPEIIRIILPNKKQYYIHQESVLPLCLKKIVETSNHYKNKYIQKWSRELNRLIKTSEMTDDMSFIRNLENEISEEDPLLYALLRYELLITLLKELKVGLDVKNEIERILNLRNRTLSPMDEILRLDRAYLYNEAKKLVPTWKTIGPLVFLYMLFTSPFKGKKKHTAKEANVEKRPKPAIQQASQDPYTTTKTIVTGNAKAGNAELRAARTKKIQELKKYFIEEGESIDTSLKSLAEKWNPLFEEKAKQNLVEDINSLIRDFYRRIKKGFQVKVPDQKRIQTLAETLASNKSFDKIKKRHFLQKYIEIYLIKLLEERRI